MYKKVSLPFLKQKGRISDAYNAEEIVKAAREKREPVLIPHFSAHHIRHTFATRLCEHESNLKVIQSIMGHADIATTMNIYAEATKDRNIQTAEMINNSDGSPEEAKTLGLFSFER